MINSKDISVVIQGAISYPDIEMCIGSIRKYLQNAQIILSTWEGSKTDGLDYDILLLNKDPGSFPCDDIENSVPNNINRQIISTHNGLLKASRKYCLKIRSDFMLTSDNFIKIFEKKVYRDNNYKFVKQPLVACNVYSRNPRYRINQFRMPYCVSDFFFFGLKEDLLTIFDGKLVSEKIDKEFFRIYPKRKKELKYKNALCRFMPEQFIIINFAKKFLNELHCDHRDDCNIKGISLSEKIIINNFILVDKLDLSIVSLKTNLFTKGQPENCYSKLDLNLLEKINRGNLFAKFAYSAKIFFQNYIYKKQSQTNILTRKVGNLSKVNIKSIDTEYVSFDIFDTLLFRIVEPDYIPMSQTGLYTSMLLSQKFKTSHIEINGLRDKYIEEYINKSNSENKDSEYKLDEIIPKILKNFDLNDREIAIYSKLIIENEIAREMDCLYVNNEALELVKSLKASNKKLLAISDMYLKKEDICKILEHFGLLKYFDEIFVSSEYGLQKFTGNLFKYVLNKYSISPSNITHIGDNIISDIMSASAFHIKTIYYFDKRNHKRKKYMQKVANNPKYRIDFLKKLFTIKNIKNLNTYEDYIQQYFAFDFINFVYMIMLDCYQKKVENIYFLERDGSLCYHIWKQLFENLTIFKGQKPKKLYTVKFSRKETANLINIDNPSAVVIRANKVNTPAVFSIKHVIGCFGLKMEDFSTEEQKFIEKNNNKLSAFYENYEDIFLPKIKVRRAKSLETLNKLHFFDSVSAICDIGWGGTMQKDFLEYIKTENLVNNDVLGYYYGIDGRIFPIIEHVKGYHRAENLLWGYSLIEFLIKNYTPDNQEIMKPTYELNKRSRDEILKNVGIFTSIVNKYLIIPDAIAEYTKPLCSEFIKNPPYTFIKAIKNVYFSLDRSVGDNYIPLIPKFKSKKDSKKYYDTAQYINGSMVMNHYMNEIVKLKTYRNILNYIPFKFSNVKINKINKKIYNNERI